MRKYALGRTANNTFYHYLQHKVPRALLGISCHGYVLSSSSGTFVHCRSVLQDTHWREVGAAGHRTEMAKLQGLAQKGLTTL